MISSAQRLRYNQGISTQLELDGARVLLTLRVIPTIYDILTGWRERAASWFRSWRPAAPREDTV